MTRANPHEVKARLSHYSRLVKRGETITLCERNKPFAEIRPIAGSVKRPKKRKLGLMKGLCPMGAEFFEADAQITADFEANEIFPALEAPANAR
ncbi:MAG: type II toxin-antitoxin system Phd/YefM family antitoxin [Verrucomicrobiales bacterium]